MIVEIICCFDGLVIAESFGSIYERNAINAGMPIMVAAVQKGIDNGDEIRVNFSTGQIDNLTKGTTIQASKFSDVQLDIYKRGGLLGKGGKQHGKNVC